MGNEVLEQQVNKLWLQPEEDLYTTLGINQQAVETAEAQGNSAALEKAQHYDTVFAAEDTEMGVLDDLKEFGERAWAKLEPQVYDLLCNKENPQHEELMSALGEGAKMLAVALVPALATAGAAVPAVIVVVATIAAKKVYDSGMETACEMWAESLKKRTEESDG